jgi:hypothetical protein
MRTAPKSTGRVVVFFLVVIATIVIVLDVRRLIHLVRLGTRSRRGAVR